MGERKVLSKQKKNSKPNKESFFCEDVETWTVGVAQALECGAVGAKVEDGRETPRSLQQESL